MRISSKARYGLAATISMAEMGDVDECITIIRLSKKLKISKTYLEQVFALLKRGGIVTSVKGAQGGYHLARQARNITVYDVLSAIETSIFEKTEATVADSDEMIEKVMLENVFVKLDGCLTSVLTGISIEDLVNQIETYKNNGNYMYYL